MLYTVFNSLHSKNCTTTSFNICIKYFFHKKKAPKSLLSKYDYLEDVNNIEELGDMLCEFVLPSAP